MSLLKGYHKLLVWTRTIDALFWRASVFVATRVGMCNSRYTHARNDAEYNERYPCVLCMFVYKPTDVFYKCMCVYYLCTKYRTRPFWGVRNPACARVNVYYTFTYVAVFICLLYTKRINCHKSYAGIQWWRPRFYYYHHCTCTRVCECVCVFVARACVRVFI